MSDLIDLSQIDSIALTSNILAVGAIVICVLAIFIAFIYGKMNASLEHKLKLKGTYEGKLKELQNIEIELKEKQSLKEDVEKKTARLKSEYEQFAANKEAIDQVKGQLNALGSEYQGKLQQLQDLDRELSKSEALKDFINNHQQEQLNALDQKIKDKEDYLETLSKQESAKLSGSIVTESLSQMFSELADNSDLKSEGQKLQREIEDLRKRYNDNDAKLRKQEKELNTGKINDAINKAFTSLNEQAARTQQEQELSSKLQQLSQQVQEKEKKLNQLQEDFDVERNQRQLSDALNTAFEQLSDTNEFRKLTSQLNELKNNVAAKQKKLDDLQSQVNEQQSNNLLSETLGHTFDDLKDTLSQSMQNLATELKKQSQLIAHKKQLENEVKALERTKSDHTSANESLKAQVAKQIEELGKLQSQVNEQQSINLLSKTLEQAFTDLKNSLSQSMQNLSSELADQSKLIAQKEQLRQEVQKEKDALKKAKSAQANVAEASDSAYEELEQTPAAIENFLKRFDGSKTEDEDTALEQFQSYLKGEGFFYSSRTLKAFHTSLKVQNINPISVLAGLSGTGKTQLALQYAKFFNFYSEHVAVQPRWDSKDDLLGFYNFLEKRYQPTELVKALYYFHQIRNNSDSPMMMVILDEMNLARVEYYFSEFLSKLELRGNDLNQPDEKSKISIGTQLNSRDFFVGSNVVFVGTMNDDESTYSLSDKVLDRANVLHFGKPLTFEDSIGYNKVDLISISASTFNDWCSPESLPDDLSATLRTNINKLNSALDSVGKAFGYRVNKSITQYIQMYPDIKTNPKEKALIALADQIEMKIIPKLAGLEQNEESNTCLRDIGNVIEYTNDGELIAAFRKAQYNYDTSGMFLWHGVSRPIDQA